MIINGSRHLKGAERASPDLSFAAAIKIKTIRESAKVHAGDDMFSSFPCQE